jgi:O-antigen/teichoic acid export membrane protein
MMIPIAVALVTVPVYLTHIGVTRYGVLSIIWVLLGYFGFADLGLARAAANALARIDRGPSQEWFRILLTALYTNALFGISGGLLVYFAGGLLLDEMLTMSAGLRTEAEGAIPWIAGMVPLTLIGGVARGAIESREKFLAINLLELVWVVLGQVFPLIAAMWIGPELSVLVPTVFAARLLAVVLALGFIAKTEKLRSLIGFDIRRLRDMLNFGAWVSVSNVITPVLGTIDQVLVGLTLGTSAVAHYAVPMSMVGRSQIVVQALARALFPRLSRLGDGEAKDLAGGALVLLAYAFGAVCSCVIILGGAFLSIWVGAEFGTPAAPVIQALMIGAWANGLASIPYTLLQGQRRPDLVAKAHICEFAPFVILLWLLIHWIGLNGAAIAWSLRAGVDAFLLLKLSGLAPRFFSRMLPPLVLLLAAYVFAQTDPSPMWSVPVSIASVPIFVACAAICDADARRALRGLCNRIASRPSESTMTP